MPCGRSCRTNQRGGGDPSRPLGDHDGLAEQPIDAIGALVAANLAARSMMSSRPAVPCEVKRH
jgi:hypothetical protein